MNSEVLYRKDDFKIFNWELHTTFIYLCAAFHSLKNTNKTIGCTVVVSIYKSLKMLLIILFSYFHLNKFSSLSSTILSITL